MNIYSKITSLLQGANIKKAATEIVDAVETKAEEAVKSEPTELLPKAQYCYKYWSSALNERLLRPSNRTSVDLHGQLHGINHHFIHSPYPKHMDEKFMDGGLTPREMISKTDVEFKRLKPTTEPMKVYRCVGEKPEFFSEYPQYKKKLNTKKGDVIMMREYAYATSDNGYANVYLPNNRGITYEIDIPAGAQVSRTGDIGRCDEVVFPRSSRFECIGTEHIKDENSDYMLIKLRYILPDEPWRQKDFPTLD